MGVYLSREYHYLLRTKLGNALPYAKRKEAADAITDMKNETGADLPEWVQKLIEDTKEGSGHSQKEARERCRADRLSSRKLRRV